MEKDWSNFKIGLYYTSGVLGGVGVGIIFSNAYLISHIYGLIIVIICFAISVYLWNTDLKKYFIIK